MPYNEKIDARITKIVSRWKNTAAKKMFGGVCHLLNGNMVCGVYKDYLILRLGEKASGQALKKPYARPFDITGKPMKGWVMLEEQGFKSEDQLKTWLNKARDFVKTLPPK
ncbi:MAG: TfoX/Sxy family protein [Desulfobacterales bacterium]|jgi:TfoX/Sxy family transcriptional regulator of competence genes